VARIKPERETVVYRSVNPQDLTGEQAWKIWLAWCTETGPDGFADIMPRNLAAYYTRKMLGPWLLIDGLEYLERQLALAGEEELARWIHRLRQERQVLN
jgi:hypothetical protein